MTSKYCKTKTLAEWVTYKKQQEDALAKLTGPKNKTKRAKAKQDIERTTKCIEEFTPTKEPTPPPTTLASVLCPALEKRLMDNNPPIAWTFDKFAETKAGIPWANYKMNGGFVFNGVTYYPEIHLHNSAGYDKIRVKRGGTEVCTPIGGNVYLKHAIAYLKKAKTYKLPKAGKKAVVGIEENVMSNFDAFESEYDDYDQVAIDDMHDQSANVISMDYGLVDQNEGIGALESAMVLESVMVMAMIGWALLFCCIGFVCALLFNRFGKNMMSRIQRPKRETEDDEI